MMGEANAAWAAYRGKMAAIQSGETFTSEPARLPAAVLLGVQPELHDKREAINIQAHLAEWLRKDRERQEAVIRGALRRFLTDQEIELTAATKSTAILAYYGLRIMISKDRRIDNERFSPPTPTLLRIYQDQRLVEEMNLDRTEVVA